MKGRQLLDAMAYIEDALIEEAAPSTKENITNTSTADIARRRIFRGAAACAAILFTAVVSLWVWRGGIVTQEKSVLDNGQNAGGAAAECAPADLALQNAPAAVGQNVGAKEDAKDDSAALKKTDTGGARNQDGMIADTEDIGVQDMEGAVEESAQQEKGGENVRLIEAFDLPAVYCYAAPTKGSLLIFAELKAAIDYYDDANNTVDLAEPESYLYHVAIDVFGETACDGETCDGIAGAMEELRYSEEGKEKLYQEYERMLSAGLDVSLSEDYQLTGTLSREEIEGFEPCSDYGYAFRFVNGS